MISDWIGDPNRTEGFVLDGFPRTLAQAEALDRVLSDTGGVDVALYIDVREDELTRRLTSRVTCQVCQTPYHLESSPPRVKGECDSCGGQLYQREDDQPAVVKKRIRVYHTETTPVVEYFRKSGRLKEIDGNRSIEEVGGDLVATVCKQPAGRGPL
jgi:adenylate kinase